MGSFARGGTNGHALVAARMHRKSLHHGQDYSPQYDAERKLQIKGLLGLDEQLGLSEQGMKVFRRIVVTYSGLNGLQNIQYAEYSGYSILIHG